jgi:hypothetical protein
MHYKGYTWDVGLKLESGHVSHGYGQLAVYPNLVVTGRPHDYAVGVITCLLPWLGSHFFLHMARIDS